MSAIATLQACTLVCTLAVTLQPSPAWAQDDSEAPASSPAPTRPERDGQHGFDWEFGTWRTHLRRLQNPLSGSSTWVEYEGTTVVREVMGGRANLLEFEVLGPAGRIEAVSLRLYNPETEQWSIYFANLSNGILTAPVVGAFENGRGEFYGQDTLDGRPIYVRFVISDITANSARFEQAFSADGGKSWEVNWIAVDTRVEPAPTPAQR